MADDVISYEIDLDTDKAEAKAARVARAMAAEFAKAWAAAGAGIGVGGGGGGGGTALVRYNRNPANTNTGSAAQKVQITTPVVQIIARLVNVAGQTVNVGGAAGGGINNVINNVINNIKNPANPAAKNKGIGWWRIAQSAIGGAGGVGGGNIAITALRGLAAAGGVAATAMTGAVLGIGIAVAALSLLTIAAHSVADALANYNAQLFAATTRLAMIQEGFKFYVAGRTGANLAALQDAIGGLVAAMAPLVSDIINLVTPGLIKFVNALTYGVLVIDVFSAAVLVMERRLGQQADANEGILMKIFKWTSPGIIFNSIKGLFSGKTDDTKELTAALDRLKNGVDGLKDELMKGGNIAVNFLGQLSEHLHDAGVVAGGQQGRGGWQQTPNGNIVPDSPPRNLPKLPSGKHPIAQMMDDAIKNGVNPSTFPRPTPAAMTFHVTDQINIDAPTDDRIFAQFQALQADVKDSVRTLNDGRWRRAVYMRNGMSD